MPASESAGSGKRRMRWGHLLWQNVEVRDPKEVTSLLSPSESWGQMPVVRPAAIAFICCKIIA